jgi:outer membrane protein OmpA-like peptidoglycan-associated protein
VKGKISNKRSYDMLHKLKSSGVGIFLLPLFLLVSCASTPPNVQEFSSTADPSQEISNLEKNLAKANSEQVDVLSPSNYENAVEALENAKEDRDDNDGNKRILKDVAVGNAWLLQANEVAKRGSEAIPDVVDVRGRALEAQAKVYAKDRLEDADDDLTDLGEEFEDGNFSVSSKDRSDLLSQYMNIELTSIKGENLSKANNNLEQAVKEGAEKIAPQTLALARKKYKDADSFITANRQDTSGIERVSQEAMKQSERVLQITRDAKVSKNKTPEQIALDAEKERNAQAQLNNELNSTQSKLGETESTVAAMSAETSQLSDQVALDEKYKEAKDQFGPNEADVYREGNKILIRLKGLRFPSDQADITASSYDLMGKVQDVLKSMGDSEVEIEGHTDSTGPRELNLRLSAERADAVKNYLVENGAVDPSNIASAGYGDEKPIASNKTKQGRAQNRRVDIIITPMM